jgi:hypothetical protein
MKHNADKRSTELMTSCHSKRYRSSDILNHRQNSYAPRSRRCTGRLEAQSRNRRAKLKKTLCIMTNGSVIVNNELGRKSEEKVVPNLGYCPSVRLEGLRKTTSILMQGSWSPG